MGTQLVQVIEFANVAPSAQVALPHNINVNGRGFVPDLVLRDNANFTIDAVTTSTITVTNTDAANPQTLNAWLQLIHSTERWFGAKQTTALAPNPFVPVAGGSVPDPLTLANLIVTASADLTGLSTPTDAQLNANVFVGAQNPGGTFTRIVLLEANQTGEFASILVGTGDPTGSVAAPVGSLFLRVDGGAGSTLYVKEGGGATAAGWAAK